MRILARRQFSDPSSTTGQPWIVFCYRNFGSQPNRRHRARLNISYETNGGGILPIRKLVETMESPRSPRPERRRGEVRDGMQRPAQPCRASLRNFSRAMKWTYLVLYHAAPRQRGRQRPAGYQRIQHRSRNAAHRYARHSLVRIRRSDRTGSCTPPSPAG